jgi:hypothetical protein
MPAKAGFDRPLGMHPEHQEFVRRIGPMLDHVFLAGQRAASDHELVKAAADAW